MHNQILLLFLRGFNVCYMNQIRHILFIDDDIDDLQLLLEATLSYDNTISCSCAINGVQAFELLRAENAALPDLITLDMNMPGMGGKECLAELKKDKRLAAIPVALITTSSFGKEAREIQKLGADWFLTKPSSFGELQSMISSIIETASKTLMKIE